MQQSIIVIRHATSSGQAPDADLTPQGHAQARHLTNKLASLGIDSLYASPYRRAQATIAPFSQKTGLKIKTLPGLHERILAPHALPDWLDHIERSFDDPTYHLIGGESLNETRARAAKALAIVANSGATRPVVVSHGMLIASVLNGIDPAFGFESWRAMKNPNLYILTLKNGMPDRYRQI